MHSRSARVGVLALAAWLSACGSSRTASEASETAPASETRTSKAPSPVDLEAIKDELSSIQSGAWDNDDIVRAGELIAQWASAKAGDPGISEARDHYQAMLGPVAEHERRRLNHHVDQLRPGFSTLIANAEARAREVKDSKAQASTAAIRDRAIAKAIKLGPQLVAVDRSEDALRFLREALRLAPGNSDIVSQLASLEGAVDVQVKDVEVSWSTADKILTLSVTTSNKVKAAKKLRTELFCGTHAESHYRYKLAVKAPPGDKATTIKDVFGKRKIPWAPLSCNVRVGSAWFCWRDGKVIDSPCPEWDPSTSPY